MLCVVNNRHSTKAIRDAEPLGRTALDCDETELGLSFPWN